MTHALTRWPNEQHKVASIGGAPLSQNLLEEAVLLSCSAQKRQIFHCPDPDSGLTHSAGSSIIKAQKTQNPSFIFSPWRLFSASKPQPAQRHHEQAHSPSLDVGSSLVPSISLCFSSTEPKKPKVPGT